MRRLSDSEPRRLSSRRDFLQGAAIAGGVAAVATGVRVANTDNIEIRQETRTIPQNEKTISVDGIDWHYREYGNPTGIPVLNLGTSAEGHDRLSRALVGEVHNSQGLLALLENRPEAGLQLADKITGLAGTYRVITPELPGFGITAPIADPTLDNLAEKLDGFQKAVSIENAIVFGSSTGGLIATKLAARYPESTSLLVLQGIMTKPADMDARVYRAIQILTREPIPTIAHKLGITRGIYEIALQRSKDYQMADPEAQAAALLGARKGDLHTLTTTIRDIGKDIGEDAAKIQCPVVILDGSNGELVPIEKSREIGRERFHIDTPLAEKALTRKVVFFPIGGDTGKHPAGEHGHNIVNTFPEAIARVIDLIARDKGILPKVAKEQ